MRYRNVKTGLVVTTTGTVTGEDWVQNEQSEYEEKGSQEPEEAPKATKGRGRSKKADAE